MPSIYIYNIYIVSTHYPVCRCKAEECSGLCSNQAAQLVTVGVFAEDDVGLVAAQQVTLTS